MITQFGNCQLEGGEVIQNVLCVPEFKFNILSMSKLIRELFTGKVKEIGEKHDGLYTLRSQMRDDNNRTKSLAAARHIEKSTC